MNTQEQAFLSGFLRANVVDPTPMFAIEALTERGLPTDDAHVACYINGNDDRARGDTFRLHLMMQTHPRRWDGLVGPVLRSGRR